MTTDMKTGDFSKMYMEEKKQSEVKEATGLPLALNIGCGLVHHDFIGYKTFNVDVRTEAGPDIVADVLSLPFDPESIDLIYNKEVMEHLSRNDVITALKHWRSLLKPGGKLITIVPDLEVAAIELLSGNTTGATWDILYGAQNYPENFHKHGHTNKSLKAMLEKFGFDIESVECKDRLITCISYKSEEVYHG